MEEPAQDVSGVVYSPMLEWPGVASTGPSVTPATDGVDGNELSTSVSEVRSSASLRLIAEHSSILPKKQTIAVIDGYDEVQIGRDLAPRGSDTPRIRLKEMEVSKFHATVYWDQDRHPPPPRPLSHHRPLKRQETTIRGVCGCLHPEWPVFLALLST